jgi:hypothetical protein
MTVRLRAGLFTAAIAAAAITFSAASAPETDWSGVAKALGKSGTEMPGGIYRVGLPRTDLKVSVDNVELKPAFALGSWVAFMPMGQQAMAMGDLVLTEDEITPVMKKLTEGGIQVTALHHHVLRARPATFYMHVSGRGEAADLAHKLHDALALSKTPLSSGAAPSQQEPLSIDTAAIDRTLGTRGQAAGGIYQLSIPRKGPIHEHGMVIPPAMGVAEGINFQPTGQGKAAITGDFVLTADEVTPVMRALQENGIEATALHNHMLDEEPRLFFMHFWVNDDVDKLTKGLRAALDKIDVVQVAANSGK